MQNFTIVKIIHGIIAILHMPLLLVIYVIRPFIEIKFGYLSTGRIGHFAQDLGYAIIEKNKNKNKITLYYLQDITSNEELKVIAKRELNVNQYYKYFVHAYIALGLQSQIVSTHRHRIGACGSRDVTGIMSSSTYDISLLDKENKISESYMKKYGWTEGENFVCVNVRDKAFFNESEASSRHMYRNSNIDDFEIAINYLLNLGYWVIRMGKKVERPSKVKHKKFVDYGTYENRTDLLDIWFYKNCYFFISTGTGIDSVAKMFKKPVLIVNLVPLMDIASWVDGITVPKRLFWNNGKELTLTEHLDNRNVNQYKEKGINVVDLSPNEIKSVVQEMVDRLNDIPLSDKQIQDQGKFWNILEHHESYGKFHGVRDPDASFGTSFLKNNPNFLS